MEFLSKFYTLATGIVNIDYYYTVVCIIQCLHSLFSCSVSSIAGFWQDI